MASQQGNFLTAIDVGSAKTCALMVEVTDGGLRYRGHGVAESRGSRKGVIVELDKAVAAIQKAVEAAEDAGGAPRLAAMRLSKPSIERGPFPCPPTARCCICCRRNLFWMTRPACTIPWA
jgi:hypothetical protein